jgi:membrane associated rhomboid family serine protease
MKHTEPGFWRYFWAYLLICAGTVVILTEIVDWAWFGSKKTSLASGIISIWLGIMLLTILKKPARTNEPSDGPKQEPPKPSA